MIEDEVVRRAIIDITRKHGLNEAVGLLYRAPGEPEAVVELTNISEQPDCSYAVRTADVMEALTLMSGKDLEQVEEGDFVLWHSHPSGAKGPSLKDMRTKLRGLRYAVVVLDGDKMDFVEY